MNINTSRCPYTLSCKLIKIIESEIKRAGIETNKAITLNFRDPTYSADGGGYHPVEIRITEDGTLSYITDFSYAGLGAYAEPVKEIDFDFSLNLFGHMGIDHPLRDGWQLFTVWQSNFCDYYASGVYQVTVS